MQGAVGKGFGHLDSLFDDIKRKEGTRVKLEAQVRQLKIRVENDASEAAKLRAEVEGVQAERVALQKKIGSLSRRNENLASENGKLLAEKCDFQRSMSSFETRLAENEEEQRRTKTEFAKELEAANQAYSKQRELAKALLRGMGAGEAGLPPPEELLMMKDGATRAEEAGRRVTELEERVQALLEAGAAEKVKSRGGRQEAEGEVHHVEDLLREVATWKEKAKAATRAAQKATKARSVAEAAATAAAGSRSNDAPSAQASDEQLQRSTALVAQLEEQVVQLEGKCAEQAEYIAQMEGYANTLEANNAHLLQQIKNPTPPQGYAQGEGQAPVSAEEADGQGMADIMQGHEQGGTMEVEGEAEAGEEGTKG